MADDRELQAMETTLRALQHLKPEERQRVFDWLTAKLGLDAPAAATAHRRDSREPVDGGSDLGPIKLFLKQKAPDHDVARATTLAYFLTNSKSQATYKTADLSKARIDAALVDFNMSRAVSHAQHAGYLTTAGKRGAYQITSNGEALVEAMPNPERIKKVREQGARRRRRSAGAKSARQDGGTAKTK